MSSEQCEHLETTFVIDELGPMQADHTGRVCARVTKSHHECADCGATVPTPKEKK